MAKKYEILVSATLEKSAASKIQNELNQISRKTKLKIKADDTQIKKIKEALDETKKSAQDARSPLEKLGDSFGKFVQWQVIGDVIHGAQQAVESMVQSVFDLDASLTELDKVTDLSEAGLESLSNSAFEVGERIGATGKDVVDAVTLFAQAGYDVKDALDLGEQAIILKNVSEAGATVEKSANTIIAAIKAFNLDAGQSTHIVNALNEVSNKYAVSVND